MKPIALPTLSILLACAAPASAASTYLETFSIDSDAQGWFQVSNGTSGFINQNPTTDVLDFGDTDASIFYIAADAVSSGGAFAGDFTVAGLYQFTFDLTINNGSSVTDLYFELSNLTADETWQYALTLPAFGSASTFTVPLGGPGWLQTSGDENFAFILGQTEEIGIALTSTATGALSGSLDNVQTIPEPSAAVIAALGLLTVASRRRRGMN